MLLEHLREVVDVRIADPFCDLADGQVPVEKECYIMSRQRAMDAMSGKATDRVAQWEWNAPPDFLRDVVGVDPYARPAEAWLAFVEKYDIDATIRGGAGVSCAKDGVVRQKGNHAYTQWGIGDTGWLTEPVYKTPDEILAFDPRTHDTSSLQQKKTDRFCTSYDEVDKWYGGRALFVPGHYQLVLHYMPYWKALSSHQSSSGERSSRATSASTSPSGEKASRCSPPVTGLSNPSHRT